jgi:SAM-dependent methyltransferase
MTLPIDAWLAAVAGHVAASAPDLAPLLAAYADEARFGAAIAAADLAVVPRGGRVLEIGAGPMLLAGGLAAAGYRVTAVEPAGPGFGHLDRLRELVTGLAARDSLPLESVRLPAERLTARDTYDYAVSINVMEHVADVAAVLRAVYAALAPGAAYRFVCPNYSCPYEPHFGIPTLGSKAATGRVFAGVIRRSRRVVDPAGTWASLNWITVGQVRDICRRELGVEPAFDRAVLSMFARRAATEPAFQERHGAATRVVMSALVTSGAADLLAWVPVALQPAMSCRLERGAGPVSGARR